MGTRRAPRQALARPVEACEIPTGRACSTLYDTKKAAGLLIDSGMSEREAMDFSGYATPSMFDRYVIKSSERHGKNVRRRDAYVKERLSEKGARKPRKSTEIVGILRK